MPFAMQKGRKVSYVGGLDDEFAQRVFSSWTFLGKNRVPVVRRIARLCKVDLKPLELLSEAIYDVESYMANAEVDRPTAEEAVERAEAAWQKPKPLLTALETFRRCLDDERVAKELGPTLCALEEHIEVTDDLIARAKKAIKLGATSVCLEADAFLL